MTELPWRLALCALVALTAACGGAGHEHDALPDPADAPVLGQPDADWTVRLLDRSEVRLGDLAGQVVFVNLWATWCSPCVQEMPSIQALADGFADEPVRFLVVSDEDPETVRRFARDKAFELPFGQGVSPTPAAFDSGGLIPATFILDRQGRVRVAHVGFRDWNTPDVHAFLRGLATTDG